MDKPGTKILSVSALIGVLLVSLLGGLAWLLRNTTLTLFLDLKKGDNAEKQ